LKKTLQTNIAVNGLYDAKLLGLTQYSVIWIIHHNVGLKCFFIYLNFVIAMHSIGQSIKSPLCPSVRASNIS